MTAIKPLVDQPTAKPVRKVKYAAVSGLLTALAIAAIDHFLPGAGDILGPEVSSLITAAVSTLVGYMTRERAE